MSGDAQAVGADADGREREDGRGVLSLSDKDHDTNLIVNAADQDIEPLPDGVRLCVKRSPDLTALPTDAARAAEALGHGGVRGDRAGGAGESRAGAGTPVRRARVSMYGAGLRSGWRFWAASS